MNNGNKNVETTKIKERGNYFGLKVWTVIFWLVTLLFAHGFFITKDTKYDLPLTFFVASVLCSYILTRNGRNRWENVWRPALSKIFGSIAKAVGYLIIGLIALAIILWFTSAIAALAPTTIIIILLIVIILNQQKAN